MNPLLDRLQDSMPRFNEDVCEGIAMKQLQALPNFCHNVIEYAVRDLFPPEVKYHGYRLCTPLETIDIMACFPRPKPELPIDRSDYYMIEFIFSFEGRKFKPRPCLLPFCRRGGVLTIRDTDIVISPAVADNLFTVDFRSIFIQFTRSRDTFRSTKAAFYANGELRDCDIVHSRMYREDDDIRGNKNSWHPPMGLYLFCYHGVEETFKKYYGVDVYLGCEDITEENYPLDKWVICESSGNYQPYKNISSSLKTRARLAVPRDIFEKDFSFSDLIASMFYSLDHVAKYQFADVPYLNDKGVWRRILLRFIFKNEDNEAKRIGKIEEHIRSIQKYVDPGVIARLRKEGLYEVHDMMDLMAYLIKNFKPMTAQADPGNCHGKILSITNYVAQSFVYRVFMMAYDIRRRSHNRLTEATIKDILTRKLQGDIFMDLGRDGHGITDTLDSATDLMMLKTTCRAVSQEKATSKRGGKKRGKRGDSVNMNEAIFHHSIIDAFSPQAISKKSQTGRARLSPFIELDDDYRILPKASLDALRENLALCMRRKEM